MTTLFGSADWGSTHFRLRVLADQGRRCVASFASAQGAAVLAASAGDAHGARDAAFAACLRDALAAVREQAGTASAGMPIVISGMAASAYGWREAPYRPLPFALDGRAFASVRHVLDIPGGPSHPLHFLSGVSHARDVMRGEETQLVGLCRQLGATDLPADFLALLPGTHCKHAAVQGGQLVDFQTYMTGELYALLSTQSVLRHTVRTPPGSTPARLHEDGFRLGLRAAPHAGLAEGLFEIRARGVQGTATPEELAGYLSGLLVGSELSGRLMRESPNRPILLCADAALATAYALALQEAGLGAHLHIIPPTIIPTLAGLGQAAFLEHAAD
ncbi:MAG: 2-dehydro-3-deoxygalactonokinase [Lentisphaerae bacterium]|nr:2-dehydro-3-deoxygalactonokinase [Lentisphaerota bacterium]